MLNHYEKLSVIGIQYIITLSCQGTLYNKHVEYQRYFEAVLLLLSLLGLIVIVPNFIFHLINGDMDTTFLSYHIIMFALWRIGANCLFNIRFKSIAITNVQYYCFHSGVRVSLSFLFQKTQFFSWPWSGRFPNLLRIVIL